MKKRILSIVLAICLVLSCVPITVFAANADTTELKALLANGGTVKLTRDYTVDSSLIVTKDVTVDLNGYVIRKTGIGRLFNIALEAGTPANARLSLTLKDSNSTRKHTGENASLPDGGVITGDPSTESGAVHIGFKGRFIMEGGTIYGFHAQWGAAVYAIWGGHFFLKNGTISNCSADFGGAVYLRYDKNTNTVDDKTNKMTMSGGAIRDCVATYAAGGVFCSGENTFTMEGGIIENCKSLNKTISRVGVEGVEGVYIGAAYIVNSTFIVNGGIIKDVVFISVLTKVENTNSGSVTKFYDNVVNIGTVSGGVYYSGIQNETGSVSIDDVSYTGTGTVTGTCYKVNFKLNGADGSIPTQWFVNTNKETVLKPANPTREGYEFKGWYNGNTAYDFTKPVTGNISLTAKWALSNVSTEAELRQSVNDGATKIKLIGDIQLTSPLLLNDKVIQLDLNGHVLKGDLTQGAYILLSATNSPSSYGAILTLKDSNPTATHTGSSLPLGGVLDCAIGLNVDDSNTFSCTLNANGGTVTKMVSLNHTRAYIRHTSGNTTPTAFKTNVSGAYGSVYSGIYYGYISENLIKGNTVTFKNGDDIYAREIVSNEYVNGSSKPGVAVAPIEPVKDGYVFAGWYNGSTKYDFTQTVTSNITLSAKWINEVTDEATLIAAINEGITTIKLMRDINLSSALDLTDKNITLDLNGYVLTGNIQLADTSALPQSILTLTDSRPTATHSDSSLPVGGVVKGNITLTRGSGSVSHLYANGGTVTGLTSLPSYAGGIFCTSDTPTAFKAHVGNYGEIHGGMFYGSINESCIKEKTVTFMNGSSRYALEVVADGNKVVEPITPSVKAGYQAFDGWYNGDTKYTFGSTISESITLTAKYSNPITYNISCNLDGGTATNQTTYNVESDAITLNNPTKTGYTFTGWSGTGLTGENNMTVTIPKGSTGNRSYTAHFSKNTYTVKFDTNGGSKISDKTGVKWDDTVLSGITAPTRDGFEFTGWKCGDMTVNAFTKYSDLAANDTVTSITPVAQWKDIQKPVITGLENGKTYCDTVEFEVSDNDGITSVKAENTTLTPGTNSKYTLAKGIGTVTVVATDKAGNETSVTVTVNNGHTYGEWQSNGDDTHTRYCTVAGCNGYEDGDCDGGEATYFKKAVCDECNEAYGELLTDRTAPTGEISIGTNKWNSFLNTITFGLFFKDTQSVTITAADDSYSHAGYTEDKAVKVEYYLYSGDTALTQADLAGVSFTVYNGTFNINPDNNYVIYARLTDHAGNVTYISSNGIVLDATVPVISGIENGKTYCEAQTVTVTEEYIESVKVNGTAVTLDSNNQFTLSPAYGTQTIVVTDKAGNVSADITVTVNNGHTYEWQDDNGQYWQKCKYCGDETAKKDIPTITINGADTVCITQDYKFSFTLPEGTTDAESGYEFTNKGGGIKLTAENGMYYGVLESQFYDENEISFKLKAYAKTTDGFVFYAEKTVAIQNEHAGGVATCIDLAICDTCGEPYGEVDSTNHNLEKISATDATVTETGNTEYWHCLDCDKYFADEKGTNEIKLDDTVISKLPPEIIKGKGQSIVAGENKELSFTSNAAFSDFLRVELDGKTLDEKNYTATEGSTVVTLKADYVATLSVGVHTIGIVSESGTAATTFTVNAKKIVNNDKKSPETGNDSETALWFALLLSCGGVIVVTGAYGKRKKYSAK